MWYFGMAAVAASLVSRSFCSKHAHGWPVRRSSVQAMSSGSVDAVERGRAGHREQDQLDAVDAPRPSVAGHQHVRPGDVDERLAVHRVGGVEVDEPCPTRSAARSATPVITMPP